MLSPDEKAAGRTFKAIEQAKLDDLMTQDPPTYIDVLWNLSKYRHPCTKRGGKTAALSLVEHYTYSPEMVLYTIEVEMDEFDRVVRVSEEAEGESTDLWEDIVVIPAGRFAFIWKDGKCRCGATARSPEGFFVEDAAERPPVEGRVARR